VRRLHGLAILALAALIVGACGQTPSARAAPTTTLVIPAPAAAEPAVATLTVPRVAGPVKIDAELEGKKM
jgi:hypothetical protein